MPQGESDNFASSVSLNAAGRTVCITRPQMLKSHKSTKLLPIDFSMAMQAPACSGMRESCFNCKAADSKGPEGANTEREDAEGRKASVAIEVTCARAEGRAMVLQLHRLSGVAFSLSTYLLMLCTSMPVLSYTSVYERAGHHT